MIKCENCVYSRKIEMSSVASPKSIVNLLMCTNQKTLDAIKWEKTALLNIEWVKWWVVNSTDSCIRWENTSWRKNIYQPNIGLIKSLWIEVNENNDIQLPNWIKVKYWNYFLMDSDINDLKIFFIDENNLLWVYSKESCKQISSSVEHTNLMWSIQNCYEIPILKAINNKWKKAWSKV